jgi:CRISPR-associated endonuclease Csn1
MKQNELFVFPNQTTGFDPHEIDLLDPKNKKLISPNLFRVQKIATKNYMFTHHLESMAISGDILKNKKELSGIMYNFIQSPNNLKGIIKIRTNHLGDIVGVWEC